MFHRIRPKLEITSNHPDHLRCHSTDLNLSHVPFPGLLPCKMSEDAEGTITFDPGSNSRRSSKRRIPTITSSLPDERTSLLDSEDGRFPSRNYTEELNGEDASIDDAPGRKNGLLTDAGLGEWVHVTRGEDRNEVFRLT